MGTQPQARITIIQLFIVPLSLKFYMFQESAPYLPTNSLSILYSTQVSTKPIQSRYKRYFAPPTLGHPQVVWADLGSRSTMGGFVIEVLLYIYDYSRQDDKDSVRNNEIYTRYVRKRYCVY